MLVSSHTLTSTFLNQTIYFFKIFFSSFTVHDPTKLKFTQANILGRFHRKASKISRFVSIVNYFHSGVSYRKWVNWGNAGQKH